MATLTEDSSGDTPAGPGVRERPIGRAAVRAAVLEAAIELFDLHGPAAVSLRDIAAAANVNLGLLHRHFGSKAELVSAAIDNFLAQNSAVIEEAFAGGDFSHYFLVERRHEIRTYSRMVAWSLLEGADPEGLQQTYPLARRLIERLEADGFDHDTARTHAATIIILGVGYSLFDPVLQYSAELGTVPADVVQSTLMRFVDELMRPPAADAR